MRSELLRRIRPKGRPRTRAPLPVSKSLFLCTEDTPISAWFYERVIIHLHVNTRVQGSYLIQDERKVLVDDFRKPETDLGIMYYVSSKGVNLDSTCDTRG